MKNLPLLFFLFIFTTFLAYSQVTINVPGDYSTIQEGIDAHIRISMQELQGTLRAVGALGHQSPVP